MDNASQKQDTRFEDAVFLIVGLLILAAIVERLTALLKGNGSLFFMRGQSLLEFFLSNILPIIKLFAFVVSVFAIVGIVNSIRKLTKINKELNAIYNSTPIAHTETVATERKNDRWERVLEHLKSENLNDWKFAIIEADIILNEMLDAMGYKGEIMSEKMRGIEKSDFLTIEEAWEAHKARNIIAHEGADYVISKSEAERIIKLYEKVFMEFHFI